MKPKDFVMFSKISICQNSTFINSDLMPFIQSAHDCMRCNETHLPSVSQNCHTWTFLKASTLKVDIS